MRKTAVDLAAPALAAIAGIGTRFNENHDPATGQFTSGDGGSGGTASDAKFLTDRKDSPFSADTATKWAEAVDAQFQAATTEDAMYEAAKSGEGIAAGAIVDKAIAAVGEPVTPLEKNALVHLTAMKLGAKVASSYSTAMGDTLVFSAVSEYTGTSYQPMNHALRRDPDKPQSPGDARVTAGWKERATLIDKAIDTARPTGHDQVVYRGIRTRMLTKLGLTQEGLAGATIVDHGFTSASRERYVAAAFSTNAKVVLEISVPKGSHVLDVAMTGASRNDEHEIIMPRGGTYEILGQPTTEVMPVNETKMTVYKYKVRYTPRKKG